MRVFLRWRSTENFRIRSALYVQQVNPKVLMDSGMLMQGNNYLATQPAVILSRQVLEKVVAMPEIAKLSTISDKQDPVSFLRNADGAYR